MASRLVALFSVATAIICLDAYLVHRYVATHRMYGPLVDFAGEQQHLCRRMELLVERGGNAEPLIGDPLLQSVESFDRALSIVENGAMIELGPLPTPPETVANAVREQRRAWNELKPLIIDVQMRPGREPRFTARSGIETGIARLLQSSFGVVEALESWRDGERLKLARQVNAVSLMGLIALVASFKLAWDHMVAPMRRLRDQILRTSARSPAEIPGNEIDAVARGFTDMSSAMSKLRQERAQISAELRRAETDYESIFDNAVAGILRTDAEGKPLLANRALARMLGYACPEELLEIVSGVDEQLFADGNHRARFDQLYRIHGYVELETKARRRDGTTVSVLESARSTRIADGSSVYDIVIVDVTPLKEAEESLRELSGELLRSQDCERRRIARELHDSTGQLLATLEMKLGRLDELLPEIRESVVSSVALADDCSRQLRSMSYLLHPPMLEEMGLVYALRSFVKGFSERSGIRVDLDAPSNLRRMDSDAELALFRVAQEGLTNVQRHAESSDAIIRLRSTEDTIRLEVEDHGRGFDEERLGSNGDGSLANMGVGMRGMAERLRQFKGRLSVQSVRGRTVVGAELPLSSG